MKTSQRRNTSVVVIVLVEKSHSSENNSKCTVYSLDFFHLTLHLLESSKKWSSYQGQKFRTSKIKSYTFVIFFNVCLIDFLLMVVSL